MELLVDGRAKGTQNLVESLCPDRDNLVFLALLPIYSFDPWGIRRSRRAANATQWGFLDIVRKRRAHLRHTMCDVGRHELRVLEAKRLESPCVSLVRCESANHHVLFVVGPESPKRLRLRFHPFTKTLQPHSLCDRLPLVLNELIVAYYGEFPNPIDMWMRRNDLLST
jgi:hypothetical protein